VQIRDIQQRVAKRESPFLPLQVRGCWIFHDGRLYKLNLSGPSNARAQIHAEWLDGDEFIARAARRNLGAKFPQLLSDRFLLIRESAVRESPT